MNEYMQFANQIMPWLTTGIVRIFDKEAGQSMYNQITNAHVTGAERDKMDFNAQQAQIQRDWEQEMANSQYQRGVADMQKAGLNPALMMNGGNAAPTPQGSTASAPAGGSGAGIGEFLSFVLQAQQLQIQKRLADAEVGVKQAEATKLSTETSGINIDNEWKERLNQAELDLKQSQKGLTEEHRANAKIVRQNLRKEGKRIDEEVKVLIQQQGLIASEEQLNRYKSLVEYMEAYEINALITYKQKVMSSQVVANNASAALSNQQAKNYAQEYTYKSKLYENPEYVDAIIDEAIAEARRAGDEAALAALEKQRKEIRNSLLSGNYFKTDHDTSKLWEFSAEGVGAANNAIANFIGKGLNTVLMIAGDIVDCGLGAIFR